jgi:hypothetical protein
MLQYKYSVSRDVPVHNITPAGAFQYTIFSQYGHSSTKYSARSEIQYKPFSQ